MTLLDRFPKLPALVANTLAGKIIQLIKSSVIDPTLTKGRAGQSVRSWPTPARRTAEWIVYLMSGFVRTMPEPSHPIRAMLKEVFEDSLTNVGISISEIPEFDEAQVAEVIDVSLPMIRNKLLQAAGEDQHFREKIDTILGRTEDWVELLRNWEQVVSSLDSQTDEHRRSRHSRGAWRFLWGK